ncbi:hypothetical protein [[Mycoplasma] mobile]|nr:hypothetical protein [[Mycoplasma] mobile]
MKKFKIIEILNDFKEFEIQAKSWFDSLPKKYKTQDLGLLLYDLEIFNIELSQGHFKFELTLENFSEHQKTYCDISCKNSYEELLKTSTKKDHFLFETLHILKSHWNEHVVWVSKKINKNFNDKNITSDFVS